VHVVKHVEIKSKVLGVAYTPYCSVYSILTLGIFLVIKRTQLIEFEQICRNSGGSIMTLDDSNNPILSTNGSGVAHGRDVRRETIKAPYP